MARNDYRRTGLVCLVWLGALLVHGLAFELIPPGTHLPEFAASAKAAGATDIAVGAALVLHPILVCTFPGLVLGLAIRRGVWKHIAAYALLQVAGSVGFTWIGGIGFGVLSSAPIVACAYGVMVGGLAGSAVRHRIGW